MANSSQARKRRCSATHKFGLGRERDALSVQSHPHLVLIDAFTEPLALVVSMREPLSVVLYTHSAKRSLMSS